MHCSPFTVRLYIAEAFPVKRPAAGARPRMLNVELPPLGGSAGAPGALITVYAELPWGCASNPSSTAVSVADCPTASPRFHEVSHC